MSDITWSVAKKDLELAVSIVLNVPPRGGITCSEFIRLSAHKGNNAVMALSSDMGACSYVWGKIPFPSKHSIYIDRRLFEPFVSCGKDLKAAEYQFKVKDGVLTVKHGSRVAVYAKNKGGSGYAEAPKYKNSRPVPLYDSWTKLLACAVSCATSDPVTPQLNCVYVYPHSSSIVSLYASNTKIVFHGKTTAKKVPSGPIAFPLLLAEHIEGGDCTGLEWDDKSVTVLSERGKLWQGVKAEARKNFPRKEIDKHIARAVKNKPSFTVDCDSLSSAADRLSGYLTAVSREDLVLQFVLKAGEQKMRLTAGTGETMFTEYVTLSKPSKHDLEIRWPLAEVLPVLIFSKDQGEASIIVADTGITLYSTRDVQLVIAKELK